MPRRVLICGSRNWTDTSPISAMIDGLEPGDVVIHGAAPGADRIAGRIATARGLDVEAFPANWARYPKTAGPIRNQQMLDEGRPTEVWAFKHGFNPNARRGAGTEHMVRIARAAGVPVTLIGD